MTNLAAHLSTTTWRDAEHPPGEPAGPDDEPARSGTDQPAGPGGGVRNLDDEAARLVRARIQADVVAHRRQRVRDAGRDLGRRWWRAAPYAENAAVRRRQPCACAQPRPPGVLHPDPVSAARVVASCPACGGAV